MSAMIIAASVGAATGIASAVIGGTQGAKAIKNQQQVATQQLRQQKLLEEATLRSNNMNTKNKIIADSIISIRSNQQQALIQATIQSQQMARDVEKKNLVYLTIGGGVIVVGSIIALKMA